MRRGKKDYMQGKEPSQMPHWLFWIRTFFLLIGRQMCSYRSRVLIKTSKPFFPHLLSLGFLLTLQVPLNLPLIPLLCSEPTNGTKTSLSSVKDLSRWSFSIKGWNLFALEKIFLPGVLNRVKSSCKARNWHYSKLNRRAYFPLHLSLA